MKIDLVGPMVAQKVRKIGQSCAELATSRFQVKLDLVTDAFTPDRIVLTYLNLTQTRFVSLNIAVYTLFCAHSVHGEVWPASLLPPLSLPDFLDCFDYAEHWYLGAYPSNILN